MHIFQRTLKTFIWLMILLVALSITTLQPFSESSEAPRVSESSLTITAKTNKESYLLRQKVTIEGNITQDGSPASDLVVIIQAEDPIGTSIAFRTLTIGDPTQTWPINITNIFLKDMTGNPINTAKINTMIRVGLTIHNRQMTRTEVYATATVFDANMVPLGALGAIRMLDPNQIASTEFAVEIPNSACTGKALITSNVYTKKPKEGGMALNLEKTTYFCISKTQQGLLEYPELPPPPPQTTPGVFTTHMRLSPDPQVGQYKLYFISQVSPIMTATTTTTFNVQSSSGYPPQASFAYWPAAPYENQTVTFDASSSTPEGFNDTIIRYEWDLGDGTPKIIKEGSYTNPPDPTVTHQFIDTGQYIVSLNVTDNEGLWSSTTKPITIYPEYGPTANFTWTPTTIYVNRTITFSATNSKPGWSKQVGGLSPIVQYSWNFSDETGIIPTADPIITHNYTQPGNYTVTLTIADSVDRTDEVSATIEILNITAKIYDVTGDHYVGIDDIVIVAEHFGTDPTSPNWDPRCDISGDNYVGIDDIVTVAEHFGEDP